VRKSIVEKIVKESIRKLSSEWKTEVLREDETAENKDDKIKLTRVIRCDSEWDYIREAREVLHEVDSHKL